MPKKRKRFLPKPRRRLKSKRTSWKKLRLSYQIKRKLELFVLALVVVLSTVAVLGILYLWQFFRTPFAEASGSFNHNPTFEKEKRYNLCLILLEDQNDPLSHIKAIAIISLDPVKSGLSVISIPVDASVEAAAGFGENKIFSLYALGGIPEPKMNVAMVTRSISSHLAIPIDAYVLTDEPGIEAFSLEMGNYFTLEEIESIFSFKYFPKIFTLLKLSRKNLRTNLNLVEVVRVLKFMFGVRSDRIYSLNLRREDLEDYEILDVALKPFVIDSKIAEERLKVQVLNGTLKSGLASRASRVANNLGSVVIDVGNAQNSSYKETILISNETHSFTVKRIKEIFKVNRVRGSVGEIEKRADITIILGLDFLHGL